MTLESIKDGISFIKALEVEEKTTSIEEREVQLKCRGEVSPEKFSESVSQYASDSLTNKIPFLQKNKKTCLKVKKLRNTDAAFFNQVSKYDSTTTEGGLKNLVDSIQEGVDPIFKLMGKDRVAFEDSQIELLDKVLNEHEVSEEEKSRIESFLLYAYGNRDLNKRIRAKTKQSDADTFIADYTFATIGSKKSVELPIKVVKEAVEEVNAVIKDYKLNEVCTDLRQIETIEQSLHWDLLLLKQLADTGDTNAKVVVDAFNELFALYAFPSKSNWTVRLGDDCKKKCEKILEAIKNLKLNNKELLDTLYSLKSQLNELIQLVARAKPLLIEFLKSNDKSIQYSKLYELDRFANLQIESKAIARALSPVLKSPVLLNYFALCQQARRTMDDIGFLAEVTDNTEAGEIVLKDEVLAKNIVGSSSTSFSQFSFMTASLSEMRKAVLDCFDKGPWLLQPYFTGSRTHSKVMVFEKMQETPDIVKAGQSKCIEIFSDVEISKVSPLDSMQEVRYQPRFAQMLTDDAIRAGITETEVKDLFAEKLQRLSKEASLKEYSGDFLQAMKSAVLLATPRALHFKSMAIKLYDMLFGAHGVLRALIMKISSTLRPQDSQSEIFENTQMRFCSEFSAELIRNALAEVEKTLQERYGDKASPSFYLKEVFPKEIDNSEIYPNKLEEIIKTSGFFEKVGRPPLLKKLFQDVPEKIG